MTIRARRFGAYAAVLDEEQVGEKRLALWRVADLERHFDRTALLASDDPPEPPYWAHLWSGARVLARAIPAGVDQAIEIGCGLGLPGLTAAARGSRVVLVDRVYDALRFAHASTAANQLAERVTIVCADFAALPLRRRFDLVLAAEVLYDRTRFEPLAETLAELVAPRGRILLTDGLRLDTQGFYAALTAAGLHWTAIDCRVLEEGLPVTIRLVEASRA